MNNINDRKVYKILEFNTAALAEAAINTWAQQSYVLEDLRVCESVTGNQNNTVTRRYVVVLSKRT